MKLQLLIAGQFPGCLETRDIWQAICQRQDIPLEIIELEAPQGQELVERLDLKSFPVLIVDGKVKAVGRPQKEDAEAILQQLLTT